MSKEKTDGGLYVDSDWKEEAAREKQRLAEQEKQEAAQEAGGGGAPSTGDEATFVELLNLLAMQAAMGLGGLQGPDGERIPANPVAAKHYIDLLEVLQKKTEGNLTDDEKRVLDSVIHELRMTYVQLVTHGASPPTNEPNPS